MIRKGSLIEVESVSYYRQKRPIKIFIRGTCINNCEIGEEAEIKTITGHLAKGTVSKNKVFHYNMQNLGKDAKEILMLRKTKN